jgi:putative aldouronate transport system permease protein
MVLTVGKAPSPVLPRESTGTRRRLRRHVKRYWQLWAMLTPAIAFVGVFAYIPMYGIQLAFRDFDFARGMTCGTWVGFK